MSADVVVPPEGRRKRRRRLKAAGAAVAVAALAWAAWWGLCLLFPFPVGELERFKAAKLSTIVLDREGRRLREFIGADDSWAFWVELDEVAPRFLQATLAAEDARFFHHPGVDPLAVARAVVRNLSRGRVVSGASTITMQIVRILERRPRTLLSKVVETFRALQLERLLTKREILTFYVNLAPYGGNLCGVEAASLRYFGKRPRDLTVDEAALLAGLPRAPSRYRPDRRPERAQARRDYVLRRMHARGYLTREEVETALKEPVRTVNAARAAAAPHFCRLVRALRPRLTLLRTTLDGAVQAAAEIALRSQVESLRRAGISNGAVVVIENQTASVRALVGSCDFAAEEDRGQVNGATSPRSPGSALKPFIYALAFEQGRMTPASVLADVPLSAGGYEPENCDHRYRGPVTAREALSWSLNVPAVRALRDVGPAEACRLLRDAGVSTLTRDAGYYGLSLALGSAEVTLLDLSNAYATLARLGVYRPCRFLETDPVALGRRVLSEAAAYLTMDVLADTDRLDGAGLWRSAKGQVRMAWKTGTSYGRRDAWTVACTPEFTVGVWLGNFDGRPAAGLVGQEAAAPVAARIMEHLYATRAPTWFVRPDSVGVRSVCRASGMAPGEHCRAVGSDLHIPGRSSGQPCTVHVAARIDSETGARLCALCSRGRAYRSEVVESWPVELASWFRQNGQARALSPPHFPGCPRGEVSGPEPRILSPSAQHTYVVVDDRNPHERITLKALGVSPRLYWFVDGALFATAAPMEPVFWPPSRGRHTVMCCDDAGRSASATVQVK